MSAPLTPAASDLQDFPFMPLHVARLRDSDLAAEESPEACWYAVLLWAASWHQLPAGSLPENDAVLARLIGLGRDVKTFRKHKAGAMRGFVLCDDGRLYHPVVAEQVISAWESKLQQRWRSECARIKKANQRNGTTLPTPTYDEWLSSGHTAPGPPSVPEDTTESPEGQRLQETGTGTGRLISTPPKPPEGASDHALDQAMAAYPESGRATSNPAKARQAWADGASEIGPDQLLARVRAFAEHHRSEGPKAKAPPAFHRWLADRRWENFATAAPSPAVPTWPGPREVWEAVVGAKSDAFARSWLSPCIWQEVPTRALVSQSGTVIRRLQQEVGPLLAGLDIALEVRAA